MTEQEKNGTAESAYPSGPRARRRDETFLDDPVVDQLLRAVVTLTMELSVTRERLSALEHQLAQQTGFDRAAIDSHTPDDTEHAARTENRKHLIEEVLKPLIDRLS